MPDELNNIFVELLTGRLAGMNDPAVCGYCRTKLLEETRELRQVNQDRFFEDFASLTSAQIRTIPYWISILHILLDDFSRENNSRRFNFLLRSWLKQFSGHKEFVRVIGAHILYPSIRIEDEVSSAWTFHLTKIALATRDIQFISSLLIRPDRQPHLFPSFALLMFSECVFDIARAEQSAELVKVLLKTSKIGDPRLVEFSLDIAGQAGRGEFALDLLRIFKKDREEFSILCEMLLDLITKRRDAGFAIKAIERIETIHPFRERLADLALDYAEEDRNSFLALRLYELINQNNPSRSRALGIALNIARENQDPDLIKKLLQIINNPENVFYSEMWNLLLTLARSGNPPAVDFFIEATDSRHLLREEILDLAGKVETDLPEHSKEVITQRKHQTKKSEERTQYLQSLEHLSPLKRLISVAKDREHSINYFPPEWAQINEEEIRRLDEDTLTQIELKLKEAQRGPWKKLQTNIRNLKREIP